jgi:uroporphyrinogen decarboxylase-like protein
MVLHGTRGLHAGLTQDRFELIGKDNLLTGGWLMMTHRERFNRVMHFQSADRIPNEEFGYWEETLERWHSERMPADADEELYFGLDIRRERRLLPINTTGPIPGLDFRIRTLDDFERAKSHYNPHSPERYPADWPERVAAYRQRDYPLGLNVNGFFGQPREWLGLGNVCVAYYEDPSLMHAMGDFWAVFMIETSRKAFAEVEIDFVQVWEDMAYKHAALIGPHTFRKFMTPYYRRFTDFVRSQGVDVILCDCDGNVNDLAPLFLEAGVNGLYPLEIVAGTDPAALRRDYPELRLMGGINKIAVIQGPDAIDAEIERAARLMEKGGYVPFIDHRAPPDITLANYRYYMARKREIIGGELLPAQCDLIHAREDALKPVKPWAYKTSSVGPRLE